MVTASPNTALSKSEKDTSSSGEPSPTPDQTLSKQSLGLDSSSHVPLRCVPVRSAQPAPWYTALQPARPWLLRWTISENQFSRFQEKPRGWVTRETRSLCWGALLA